MGGQRRIDVVVIGTGMGEGTLAAALCDTGLRVLLVERGDVLPTEEENWRVDAVFGRRRYRTRETWFDGRGRPFTPNLHPWVGGNPKVYGAALLRLRQEDFQPVEHVAGLSPGWPISYEELEPYYCLAEQLYGVHGKSGDDPTEPPRSCPYPYPPVPHEPLVQDVADRLRQLGLHPAALPLGLDRSARGRCLLCRTCDGLPCHVLAKADADVRAVRPALTFPTVELRPRTFARRLLLDARGQRIRAVEVETEGTVYEVAAEQFVLACGAVHSAALLLRSATSRHPRGLANSSGVVGRFLMTHHNTLLMAIDRRRRNTTTFQKRLALFDFYRGTPDFPYPAGSLQLVGRRPPETVLASFPHLGVRGAREIVTHSVDWWVLSEDLPEPGNRITVSVGGQIRIHWQPSNGAAHRALLRAVKAVLRHCGFREFLEQPIGLDGVAHFCGTVRFGNDPATPALDPTCRAWEIEHLWVADASVFPSSGAVSPALTIAALALRTAEFVRQRFGIHSPLSATIDRVMHSGAQY